MNNIPDDPLLQIMRIENESEIESMSEPPVKKTKRESLYKCIDMYIDKLKQCSTLKPVLGDEFEQPLPLVRVSVGHIKNPKEISKTILILNEKVPLEKLSHLKRARGRDIVLCPTSAFENSSIQEFIETNIPELKHAFDYFKEVDVPAVAPKVKKQYSGLQMWSLHFFPNKYLESLLSDNFFPRDQLKFHITCLSMVFETARWHLKDDTDPDLLKEINVTIIVDPSIYTIVAVAFCNKDHPIQHSTMLAIDNVAKTQNGGAWGESTINSFNCTLSGIDRQLQLHLKQEFRQISFGARVFKSKRAANTSESAKSETDNMDTSDSPYLCTGYYVYCLREPCLMCAMALVHARAKRIFYCFDNARSGGLKSKVKLQSVESLNHHYEVFNVCFEKDNF